MDIMVHEHLILQHFEYRIYDIKEICHIKCAYFFIFYIDRYVLCKQCILKLLLKYHDAQGIIFICNSVFKLSNKVQQLQQLYFLILCYINFTSLILIYYKINFSSTYYDFIFLHSPHNLVKCTILDAIFFINPDFPIFVIITTILSIH